MDPAAVCPFATVDLPLSVLLGESSASERLGLDVKGIPEGSRVDVGIKVFAVLTAKAEEEDFGADTETRADIWFDLDFHVCSKEIAKIFPTTAALTADENAAVRVRILTFTVIAVIDVAIDDVVQRIEPTLNGEEPTDRPFPIGVSSSIALQRGQSVAIKLLEPV